MTALALIAIKQILRKQNSSLPISSQVRSKQGTE